MLRRALFLSLAILIWPHSVAIAKHNSEHPLSAEDWQEVMEKVSLLDGSVFIPSLLPIIMTNQDALQLSDDQLSKLYEWRRSHYVNMVNIMNQVIEMKLQFSIESLSTNIDDNHLIELQGEIHRLQHRLLKIRLSCRKIMMETFTEEQWDNFEFIAADNPRISSFLSQSRSIRDNHSH